MSLELIALPGIPMVEPGDNLTAIITASLNSLNLALNKNDVLVVAQKIISKAENRYALLSEVTPTAEAEELATEVDKDPRLVQLILDQSTAVIRQRPGVLVVEHKLGYIHANAGIDQSNIQSDPDNPRVLLLPENPDASAAKLRAELPGNPAVIINDSAGRAWRNGTLGFAIGTAGFAPLVDLIGRPDLFGRTLEITQVAVADELAAAASFLMGQADEAAPVVVIRGAKLQPSGDGSSSLIRPPEQDLFR